VVVIFGQSWKSSTLYHFFLILVEINYHHSHIGLYSVFVFNKYTHIMSIVFISYYEIFVTEIYTTTLKQTIVSESKQSFKLQLYFQEN
jgi:hypothetical protein